MSHQFFFLTIRTQVELENFFLLSINKIKLLKKIVKPGRIFCGSN